MQYALWCGYFEDSAVVKEAWDALTGSDTPSAALRAVLRASGPVPYELKAALYERLLPDPAWHEAIGESLLWSTVDTFGQVERAAARRVLQQLRLPPDLPGLQELRTRLASPASRPAS